MLAWDLHSDVLVLQKRVENVPLHSRGMRHKKDHMRIWRRRGVLHEIVEDPIARIALEIPNDRVDRRHLRLPHQHNSVNVGRLADHLEYGRSSYVNRHGNFRAKSER